LAEGTADQVGAARARGGTGGGVAPTHHHVPRRLPGVGVLPGGLLRNGHDPAGKAVHGVGVGAAGDSARAPGAGGGDRHAVRPCRCRRARPDGAVQVAAGGPRGRARLRPVPDHVDGAPGRGPLHLLQVLMETRVRIPVTERVPVQPRPKHRRRFRRRAMAAGRVVVAMAVCLATWMLLNADTLKRSAQASPPGTRRSASLAVLRPVAAASHALFIGRLGNAIQRALGRNPTAAPGTGSTIVTIGPRPSLPGHPTLSAAPTSSAHPTPSGHASPSPSPSGPSALSPLAVPTKDDPLRVLVVGDSFATDVGYGLARAFNTH